MCYKYIVSLLITPQCTYTDLLITVSFYRIRWNIGREYILVDWRIVQRSTNIKSANIFDKSCTQLMPHPSLPQEDLSCTRTRTWMQLIAMLCYFKRRNPRDDTALPSAAPSLFVEDQTRQRAQLGAGARDWSKAVRQNIFRQHFFLHLACNPPNILPANISSYMVPSIIEYIYGTYMYSTSWELSKVCLHAKRYCVKSVLTCN